MAEKIVSIKSGKVIEKDGKDWVELIDQDDKTHRIFRSIQNNEGNWVHLDKEVDFLKSKIEAGEIEGVALKLNKEKKGTFWNVTGVEEVKDVLKKEALQQVTGGREASIEQQVAIKEVGENWRAGIFNETSPEVIAYQAWILDRLNGYLKGGKDVPNKVSTKETGRVSGERLGQGDREAGEFDEKGMKAALNRVKFTQKGVIIWLNQMFGIKETENPIDMMRQLNTKQLEVFLAEIKSREKEKVE